VCRDVAGQTLVKMELISAQSWSKWNWYLLKIDCKTRKNLVKVWDKMVLSMFMLVRKFFLTMLMLVRKIFFTSPRQQHFREKFVWLGQNPRNCWSKHDDTPPPPPPPPNVDGFATSLYVCPHYAVTVWLQIKLALMQTQNISNGAKKFTPKASVRLYCFETWDA
jgi:hypothetical protein